MSVYQQELIRSARRLALAARSSPRPWQNRASPIITKEQRLRFLSTQSKVSSEPQIAATTPVFASSHDLIPPSSSQLRTIMIHSALPMIGFGFMDQAIMIHAGNAIDCTVGVSLGLSTLAAAAVGQIVANTGGILFGETLQRFFTRFSWIEATGLHASQLALPIVARARCYGTVMGLIFGCCLGLVNLLCIDTQRSSDLKMNKALTENDYLAFEIYVSNQHILSSKYQPATTLTICGPEVDGILSVMLSALKDEGFSVVEISVKPKDSSAGDDQNIYEDIFVVKRKGKAIPEEELTVLAKRLLKERLSIPVSGNGVGCDQA